MKKFMLTLLATAALTGATLAQRCRPCPPGRCETRQQPRNRVTCIRKEYNGWTKKCWFPKYRCHGYYSPHLRKWFYYYAKKELFVPVEHIDVLKPTPEQEIQEDDPKLPEGAVDVDLSGNDKNPNQDDDKNPLQDDDKNPLQDDDKNPLQDEEEIKFPEITPGDNDKDQDDKNPGEKFPDFPKFPPSGN